MMQTARQLKKENEELRLQLSEAEELLTAIRNGEVDAIVVKDGEGEKIFSISSSETPYRIIIEEMQEGAVVISADGLILYCNRRFAELVDIPMKQVSATNFTRFVKKHELQEYNQLFKKATNERVTKDLSYKTAAKNIKFLRLSFSPLPQSMLGDICITVFDLTVLKLNEEELLRSQHSLQERTGELNTINERLTASNAAILRMMKDTEQANERYNLAAKATSDFIWDLDITTGKLTSTGDGFGKLFGYKIDEAENANADWSKLIHPEDVQKVKEKQLNVFSKSNEFYWEDEYRFIKANGQYVYVYGKGYIIRDKSGAATRMIGATQDVTKHKEQVNEITRIQHNLDSLINNTKDMIWSISTDYKIITANKAYSDTIEIFTGKSAKEGDEAIQEIFGEGLATRWAASYKRALAAEAFSIEETFNSHNTGECWHAVTSFSPIININGSITGVACFSKDITELRNAYAKVEEMNKILQNKVKELARSNNELEQFAHVASHDLQEPLRMVTSFVSQLEKKYGGIIDDKGKKYINLAVDGARRMHQIILDLLEFSRAGSTENNLEGVDLNQLIDEIKIIFSKQFEEKNATINAARLPVIYTCKVPVRQVFQNLVNNALKYSRKNTSTQIDITFKEFEKHWQFAVSDNGIGIAGEYFDKIFVIFQRLHNKDEFSGTGIGLAITKKVIENLGGKIWVESEEGKGSTFYFTLLKPHN